MAGEFIVSKADKGPESGTKGIKDKLTEKALASAAKLVKLLPTTTVLAFQVLLPPLSNGGHCLTVNRFLTALLLGFCGISCFIASFTDSYKGDNGRVYYGIATKTGLWTFSPKINTTVDLSSYRLKFKDFVHAVLSVLVFAAVATMNNDVVRCYYPSLKDNAKDLLMILPIGVGFLSSLVFLVFPSKRHGIGYPHTK